MGDMLFAPPRGGIKPGLTFGYVDVPEVLTAATRPFLDKLTQASYDTQQRIRGGREIDIDTRDVVIVAGGVETKVRLFLPDGEGPFPIMLYCHGGGFAIRDVDCFDYIGRYLAKNSPSVVVMPEYLLAPENIFPAQFNQCFDTLLWARSNADNLKANASWDTVAGDSAGGNLSAAICLKCRDEGIVQPAKQILIYPLVDATLAPQRESEKIYGTGYNLDYQHLLSYNNAYATNPAHPYVSPLLASDHHGLAECFMISAECDVLIDQGLEYLKRLKDSNVPISYQVFRGMPHDFLFFAYDESYQAYNMICQEVKRLSQSS